ncbi:PAS domain S-box protein [Rhodoferax sp.]|uniref:CHASE domain-containing hybrid sensor histidine kinase/response regulator n=1 Tax=Rhodoferax sp. TaxID=50421 RepID=UPI001ED574D6|nr:PAS domain S-box protein [Rhodoferax sp.]MBT9505864.1 PAS domain S-box protein [Rhodoferax sp.]
MMFWHGRFTRSDKILAGAVFLIGLSLSAGIGVWVQRQNQALAQSEFDSIAARISREVARRFGVTVYGLKGIRSMYSVDDRVVRREFRDAIAARDLLQDFPGVRGFGFIQHVMRKDLEAFVASERADDAPQFAIRQLEDKTHDDLFVIKLIEPAAHNIGAQGLDVGSEPRRRAAAQLAVDTGQPAITAAITLVQDNRRTPGVLLFVPVYAIGTHPSTPAERRAALVGLLYAPIVIAELLDKVPEVVAGGADFELFDAPQGTPDEAIVFDADNHLGGLPNSEVSIKNRRFRITRQISLPGRHMTLQISSTPAFESRLTQSLPWLVSGAGTLLSALLALLMHQQATGRRRAETMARGMTSDLDRLAQVVKNTTNVVLIADTNSQITWVNEAFTRVTGYAPQEALGRTPIDLLGSGKSDAAVMRMMAKVARAGEGGRFELLLLTKDGQERWLNIEIQPQRDAQGQLVGFMEIGTDVTDRRMAQERLEAALRDNDALLSTLNMHAIVSVADRAGRITEVNDAFCAISGYSRAELLGRNHRIINSGKQTDSFWVAMWHTIEAGKPWRGEVCNRAKDGSLYWVDTFIAPFIGDDGKVDKYISIRTDITASKTATRELTRERQRLGNIIEGTNVGTWEWNVETGDVQINERWAQIIGYTSEEVGVTNIKAWSSFIHPDDLNQSVKLLNQHVDGLVPAYDCELRLRHKDGRWVWALNRGKLFSRSDDGHPRWMAGTLMDITERKLADAEVKRSAELLRGAIGALDEAFVLFDPDDRLVYCNEKYREIYETVAHLMVPGVSFETLIRTGAENGQYLDAIGRVDEWVDERVAAHRASNSTLIQRHDNGRTLRIVERKLPDGHIVGFRIDITELIQATEAAQEASRAKSQFLANMSHELRTPMNAILGMLTLLRKTELTPRQADYAVKSDSAARSLLGLLNEILDFSKIEAGKMTLDPYPFHVDQLLRDLSVILSTSVGAKPVEVLFDIDPALPRYLVGDAMRLQQVLINLSSNAIKFTAEGEVILSIAVVQQDDSLVTMKIGVRDSGIGIAPENQARIFSGFTQAEASTTRRFGGTGLGVAISQRFVALMGGQLQLESALGQGSFFHFSITLPLASADAEEASSQPSPAAARPKQTWRTLVVDDNLMAREVLQRMGQSLGWAVDLADSGEAALELLQTRVAEGTSYQAMFVDWQMPGMDGWQTCERIRNLNLTDVAPVLVMVTAHGRETLSQRSAADQALLDGFLVKPVTASMLFDAVMDARSDHDLPHPSVETAQIGGQRLAGMRLLVVEDNIINQQVALELLENEGAVVQIANHGQEGVAAVATAQPPFDVVLMDLQMPVMDGLTAARTIRKELGLLTLPIVAMTANAMASDREACLAAGMNDHVGKPFDLNHLVRVLRQQSGRDAAPEVSAAVDWVLPAAVTNAAVTAGVDIAAALRRIGGKQDLYRQMLGAFVLDLEAMPARFQAHAKQVETDAASRLAHTLKGVAATLGATALAAVAAQGEKDLSAHPGPSHLASITEALCTAMALARPGLTGLWQAIETATMPSACALGESIVPTHDSAALLASLRALAVQLQDSDMVAMESMAQLQQRFGATLGCELAPLHEAIGALDFERALRVCSALIESQTA